MGFAEKMAGWGRRWAGELRRRLLGQPAPDSLPMRAAAGLAGENAAVQMLRDRGFRIVTRNWRGRHGELDAVAWDGPVLVFVEVRARQAEALVSGFHTLDRRKKKALRLTCLEYLRRLRPAPKHFRLDVVEVRLRAGRDPILNHYANVHLFHA